MQRTERGIKIGQRLGDVADATLSFYRQIGVEEVSMPGRALTHLATRPLVPAVQLSLRRSQPEPWDERLLREVKRRIEGHGLVASAMTLPVSGAITAGRPERDRDLERACACIRVAGRVGLRTLTYSFTALRPSEGYGALRAVGRGGADLRDFDHDRIVHLPSLPDVGQHTMDEMWERLGYFLHVVVPEAAKAGIRLAAHPNDPPVPVYRGVAQPLGDVGGWQRLIDIVDSPSNCVFFDTGVTTELGENAPALIRYFGRRDRIGNVHFRNVRVQIPRFKYVETFVDQGDCDMMSCAQALHDVGYDGMIDPDHTPLITNDTSHSRVGWAFAIGHMIALRNAVEPR